MRSSIRCCGCYERPAQSLQILPVGVDRLESALLKARSRRYSRQEPEMKGLSEGSLRDMFDADGEEWKIKDWIAEGTQWVAADVRSAEFANRLGRQDVVLVNNTFIHMNEAEARAGLLHLAQIVRPGSLVICQGVDLDVRERSMREMRFQAVPHRIEEIHNSESNQEARSEWPWKYWSLEPLDKTRKRWIQRYASIFQAPCDGESATRFRHTMNDERCWNGAEGGNSTKCSLPARFEIKA